MRQVDHVEPGAELDFTPWGTPGARAVLAIDGAARPLRLSETSPGRYTLVAQFDGLSMKRDVSVTRSGTTLNGVLPSSLD